MGARPLQRVIDDQVKRPLSRALLFGKLKNGGSAHISVVDDNLTVLCEEAVIEQVQDA
jgi:ATP-dependent Clp protease ATP-binding subunit ClpA